MHAVEWDVVLSGTRNDGARAGGPREIGERPGLEMMAPGVEFERGADAIRDSK